MKTYSSVAMFIKILTNNENTNACINHTNNDCKINITGIHIGRETHINNLVTIHSHHTAIHIKTPPENIFHVSLNDKEITFANSHTISNIPINIDIHISHIFAQILIFSLPCSSMDFDSIIQLHHIGRYVYIVFHTHFNCACLKSMNHILITANKRGKCISQVGIITSLSSHLIGIFIISIIKLPRLADKIIKNTITENTFTDSNFLFGTKSSKNEYILSTNHLTKSHQYVLLWTHRKNNKKKKMTNQNQYIYGIYVANSIITNIFYIKKTERSWIFHSNPKAWVKVGSRT